ncbi:PHB depolymerase family esterase [Streptomyces sp. AJS327]|uniref:extracellular catalytic domain type 1 short-chain-length polyhydroxyalkanoate depolymerase n=1 Tax=Streptomyces sp. AJS327 TaxID=2545265 RepID=UPI0015DEC714|nr:PHB depolymerase family esterase [Streptomyces sp. AJS327]MBA0051031.1 PHB depolymerase family esterase [Streptomyces sp. AJS327]
MSDAYRPRRGTARAPDPPRRGRAPLLLGVALAVCLPWLSSASAQADPGGATPVERAVTPTERAEAPGEPAGASPRAGRGAASAELEPVPDFGANPGALSMFRYVPDGLPSGSPVVVVLHGCTQDAATYVDGAGWREFADEYGFAVVAPQQETANNANRCFNWFERADTARDSGEAASIRRMVEHTVGALDADPGRVFVTGLSAGGGMTSSLLAAYPDAFAGGAVIAGIPHGCASSLPEAFGCMNPGVTRTPAQWGDLVRSAHPDHEGDRPKVAVWHGTADTTVHPRNATESVKQWTDVLGADQTPDAEEQLPDGTTRSEHTDGSGEVVVREYVVPDMGHGTPVRPSEGCGRAGAHFLDTLCSTRHITGDWGLSG